MKQIILLLVLLLLSFSVSAAPEIFDESLDAVFLPLIDIVRPLFVKLSFVVGGIFGAYIILIIIRVYYERKTVKLLKAIKFNLDESNKFHGIRYSSQRTGFFQKIREYFAERNNRKAMQELQMIKKKKKEHRAK